LALTSIQVEKIFNASFSGSHNTCLQGGFDEPEYTPSSVDSSAQIGYKFDYVQSALHEVAHWCIAGQTRRNQLDYGYWYAPDGRNTEQQKSFFLVESRPQGLEWIFSSAAGLSFLPSVDNLNLQSGASDLLPHYFVEEMKHCAIEYLDENKPTRANQFISALQKMSGESLIPVTKIIEMQF